MAVSPPLADRSVQPGARQCHWSVHRGPTGSTQGDVIGHVLLQGPMVTQGLLQLSKVPRSNMSIIS